MKVLLVIGGSSDLGSNLIKKVYDSYDYVWVHYCGWNKNMDELKNIGSNKIEFFEANLTSDEEVQNMISHIEGSGYMPNHIVHFAMSKICIDRFNKLSLDKVDMDWSISYRSSFKILQAFLPKMAKEKYGKVIFTISSVSFDPTPKYQAGYISIKYAMLGLMKSLASEYQDKGICINGVSPDMIQTAFISDLPELMVEQYKANRPNNKILTVNDVIPTYVRLLSDDDHTNGENILIN